MNRLTARDEHGNAYYPRCFDEPCNGGGYTKDMCDFSAAVCEKLAAYEDTGIDPEQLSVIDEEYSKMAKELAEFRKYKRLGTLEEVRDAAEKQRAKNPKNVGIEGYRYTDTYRCPTCGNNFSGTGIANYCYHCGQQLNWE